MIFLCVAIIFAFVSLRSSYTIKNIPIRLDAISLLIFFFSCREPRRNSAAVLRSLVYLLADQCSVFRRHSLSVAVYLAKSSNTSRSTTFLRYLHYKRTMNHIFLNPIITMRCIHLIVSFPLYNTSWSTIIPFFSITFFIRIMFSQVYSYIIFIFISIDNVNIVLCYPSNCRSNH